MVDVELDDQFLEWSLDDMRRQSSAATDRTGSSAPSRMACKAKAIKERDDWRCRFSGQDLNAQFKALGAAKVGHVIPSSSMDIVRTLI